MDETQNLNLKFLKGMKKLHAIQNQYTMAISNALTTAINAQRSLTSGLISEDHRFCSAVTARLVVPPFAVSNASLMRLQKVLTLWSVPTAPSLLMLQKALHRVTSSLSLHFLHFALYAGKRGATSRYVDERVCR